MLLRSPVCITARLLPGVKLPDGSSVSIEYSDNPGSDHRTRYRYHIDSGENEYTADDLQSGVSGGSLQEGLESLLAFLSSYGESYRYHQQTQSEWDDKPDIPDWLLEWCYLNSEELGALQWELSEIGGLIAE